MEEFLKPLGLSQTELAAKLDVSYPRISELVHGKRGVTPDTALRLDVSSGWGRGRFRRRTKATR